VRNVELSYQKRLGFCTNCGTSTGKTKAAEKIADTEIQLSVKPVFKFVYVGLPILLYYGILLLPTTILFGIMSASLGWLVFCIGAMLIGATIFFIKKQYDSYTYDFYKTKVIYKDSFINLSEKEVKYKYVREVTMRQTFIQRYFNIGNIVLFTNAETGYGNGIRITNVENVQDVYRNIKSIIDV